MSTPAQEFQNAMSDAGLVCTDPLIADGNINRLHVEGDRPGTKNGWYVFYPDSMPAGAFGSWRNCETHTWCSKRTETMTEAERAEYRHRIGRAKAEMEQEQKEARAKAKERANRIWKNAKPAPPDHPYLVKKCIKPFGIRLHKATLVIPVRHTMICSLQFIDAEGNKRFLPDGAVQGHYHIIGTLTETLYISEGYATAASVHQATGAGVAVAFNAGNLEAVAKAIRQKHPNQMLVIAGDNDVWTDGNPGVTLATEAAKTVRAKIAIPQFKDTAGKPSDFNDLHQLEGLDAVRGQLANAKEPETSGSETNQQADASKTIADLAELSPIEYERRRPAEAKKLGIRVAVLDKEVWKLKVVENGSDMAGSAVLFEELEPWPHPVDTTELLNELVAVVKRHVVLLEHTPEAIALWTAHTHTHDAATISPILAITSPEKRCGKTTKLSVLQAITPRPLFASNLTVATLFRAIEQYRPTLLVDEADTFLRDNEELRGILNSGHTRNGACVLRTVGDAHELRTFSTWGPKAIALIGNISPTLQDRSIVIHMRRKRPNDTVERFRLDRTNELKEVARRCARWAVDNMEELRGSDPVVPDGLNDRAADNWRPLLAIADMASGDWAKRARNAAEALSVGDDGESAGVQLLRDLQELFSDRKRDQITSADLVEALVKMEERPWPEWKKGKPITTRQVARLLKPFDIAPEVFRVGETTHRGYNKDDCIDAFTRYLGDRSVTAKQTLKNRDLLDTQSVTPKCNVTDRFVTENSDVTDRKSSSAYKNRDCYDVTDETPENAGSGKVVGVNI